MTPATAFTKAVCERASKDGWELALYQTAFFWNKGKTTHQGYWPAHNARELLWAACCDLQQREYPDLQVTID